MRGNIFILCIIAIILSVIAIILAIIAFWSTCNWNYDGGNAIMSTFSILVTILIGAITILIGWQVYNHYVAKEEIKKMIEEEAKILAEDIVLIIDSNAKAEEDTCHFITSTPSHEMFEAHMRSLEIAKKCHINVLKNNAIDYTMKRFHKLYIDCIKKGTQMEVIKNKRKEYEYLCKDIEHKYIEELRDYITQAIEFEEKDS